VREGDLSIDRRGRMRAAPAILSYGFRPFFLGAALHAAFAVPLWLWMYRTGVSPAGPFPPFVWHAHEMIFGYLAAAMAGFVLTAIPNWTGRLPLSGAPLAFLFALWLAGRAACLTVAEPAAALFIDLAFPLALAAAVWREIRAGKNWRNIPVAILLTLLAGANLLHHLESWWPQLGDSAVRLALAVAAMMIALIGGRITPSFTRNWLVKRGETVLPAPFGIVDKAALAATLAASLAWIAATVPPTVAIHALTAGAIGTMTLAVMTRATLGHTGRAIETDALTAMLYAAVTLGAILRVAAPFTGESSVSLLTAGGVLWTLAFILFLVRYGPMLVTRRL
jgi:uncharacterized protein involved in response to NO